MANELQSVLDDIKLDKQNNLKPNNIKKDITVLGVTGTLETEGADTSDATAIANDIISPKTAYANGKKLTGMITTETEVSANLNAYDNITNLTTYSGYAINDYDLANNVYVVNDKSTFSIGRITTNGIEKVSKTFNASTLSSAVYNITITDIKFSKVYSDEHIKLFISARSTKNTDNSYPPYNEIYLVKLNKETLEIEKIYRTGYDNYLDWHYTKEGSLIVHPKKDIAVAIFLGSANGKKSRYMASKYNASTDTFVTIMTGGRSRSYDDTFMNSYCTNDGYAIFRFGTSTTTYETYIFKIDDESVNFSYALTNTYRLYTNNNTYIYNNALYDYSGTKLKDITLEGQNPMSRITLLDNLMIYGNATSAATTSCTIRIADTSNLDITLLDQVMQERHPHIYTSNSSIIMSNRDNTTVSLYKPSDEIVTSIYYRDTKFYSGIHNTAKVTDILKGKTAIVKGATIRGTMPDIGSLNYIPSISDQSIPTGYTSGGTVKGDSNLVADNIALGKSIFGIEGKAIAKNAPQIEVEIINEEQPKQNVSININNVIKLTDTNYILQKNPTTVTANIDGDIYTQEITTTENTKVKIEVPKIHDVMYCNYNDNFEGKGNITNTITKYGSPSIQSTTGPYNISGNKALRTTGNSYIQYNFPSSISDYHISFWFYKSNSDSYSRVLYVGGPNYEIEVKYSSDGIYWGSDYSIGWLQNKWNKLELKKVGNTVNLYCNSVWKCSRTYSASMTYLRLGAGSSGTSNTFNGWFEDLVVTSNETGEQPIITYYPSDFTYDIESVTFGSIEEMNADTHYKEKTLAVVIGTTYLGTFRLLNGVWEQVDNIDQGQEIMTVLNTIASTSNEYESTTGDDNEINQVLDNILG